MVLKPSNVGPTKMADYVGKQSLEKVDKEIFETKEGLEQVTHFVEKVVGTSSVAGLPWPS